MNRIYILGKVIKISKVRFDYRNKLKANIFILVFDEDNNEFFKVYISEKYCDFVIQNIKKFDIIFMECFINMIEKRLELTNIEISKSDI